MVTAATIMTLAWDEMRWGGEPMPCRAAVCHCHISVDLGTSPHPYQTNPTSPPFSFAGSGDEKRGTLTSVSSSTFTSPSTSAPHPHPKLILHPLVLNRLRSRSLTQWSRSCTVASHHITWTLRPTAASWRSCDGLLHTHLILRPLARFLPGSSHSSNLFGAVRLACRILLACLSLPRRSAQRELSLDGMFCCATLALKHLQMCVVEHMALAAEEMWIADGWVLISEWESDRMGWDKVPFRRSFD